MKTYLVRDNETLEPKAFIYAKNSLNAAVHMRVNFVNQPVHLWNIENWTFEQKAEALQEIVANCPTNQVLHV